MGQSFPKFVRYFLNYFTYEGNHFFAKLPFWKNNLFFIFGKAKLAKPFLLTFEKKEKKKKNRKKVLKDIQMFLNLCGTIFVVRLKWGKCKFNI